MATKEDILGQFQLYNINPTSNVINKCLSLCLIYNIEAEDLVDQWVAYTTSNLRGEAPTVEHLEKMERKEYQKNKDQVAAKLPSHKDQSPCVISTHQPTISKADILGTPKSNQAPHSRIQTPIQSQNLANEFKDSISSPGSQTANYSKRANALAVQCSYGSSGATFKSKPFLTTVKMLFDDGLTANQTFLYEVIGKKGKSLNNMAEDLIIAIRDKYKLGLSNEEENDEEVSNIYAGRIVSDSDGKLNNQSVLLEQTQVHMGRTIQLNLSKVNKYSLFPGQVVVVKGDYTIQYKRKRPILLAQEIFADTDFTLPSERPLIRDNLQIVVACGPFTIQDTIAFEPLNDLINYVKEYKPHVLILAGPFYEKNNQAIHSGELRQSFDSFFMELVDTIMTSLESTDVKVVIASSQREPHHYPVYPTPPYEIREKYANLIFVPDPFLLDINGVVVGATTPDILFNLSTFEIHLDKTNASADRMGRLASHLLEQQSFYPLDPPSKDVCIDATLMEKFGVMGVKPHILILPSNLRHFIKEINECLVINPERLTKSYSGGTFARIEVAPGSTATLCGRTTCQIMRI